MSPTMTCDIICKDMLVSERFNEIGDNRQEMIKLARENYSCLKELYQRFPDEIISFDNKRDAIAVLTVVDMLGEKYIRRPIVQHLGKFYVFLKGGFVNKLQGKCGQ